MRVPHVRYARRMNQSFKLPTHVLTYIYICTCMYVHASNLINTLIYKSIDYQKATTAAAAPARLSIKTYSKYKHAYGTIPKTADFPR